MIRLLAHPQLERLARRRAAVAAAALALVLLAACKADCRDACTELMSCQSDVDPRAEIFSVHTACLPECEGEACEGTVSRDRWIDCLASIDCDSAAGAKKEIGDCSAKCRPSAASSAAVHLP